MPSPDFFFFLHGLTPPLPTPITKILHPSVWPLASPKEIFDFSSISSYCLNFLFFSSQWCPLKAQISYYWSFQIYDFYSMSLETPGDNFGWLVLLRPKLQEQHRKNLGISQRSVASRHFQKLVSYLTSCLSEWQL